MILLASKLGQVQIFWAIFRGRICCLEYNTLNNVIWILSHSEKVTIFYIYSTNLNLNQIINNCAFIVWFYQMNCSLVEINLSEWKRKLTQSELTVAPGTCFKWMQLNIKYAFAKTGSFGASVDSIWLFFCWDDWMYNLKLNLDSVGRNKRCCALPKCILYFLNLKDLFC